MSGEALGAGASRRDRSGWVVEKSLASVGNFDGGSTANRGFSEEARRAGARVLGIFEVVGKMVGRGDGVMDTNAGVRASAYFGAMLAGARGIGIGVGVGMEMEGERGR